MKGKTKFFIIFSLIFLIVLTPIYIYIILPNLKPTPTLLSSKTITIKISEETENFILPIVNPDFGDLSGWKIEKGNVNITSLDYFFGRKSVYITSDEEFILSQKLNSTYCDYSYL